MKHFAFVLTCLIFAVWIAAIALLSVQNYTPVSLRFFTAESFQMPVGLVLAFSVGLGLVGTAIVQSVSLFAGESYDEEE